MLKTGELQTVLPGTYAARAAAQTRVTRVLAAAMREPDAVFVGRTAAQLSYWPGLGGDVVVCAVRRGRPARPGFRFVERVVAPELVQCRGPLRMTVPALTALDLCEEVGGDGIDRALRVRVATLTGLRTALELSGHRRGNRDRRALLLDSRDEPWSAAERLCHRLLRSARLIGWRANHPVELGGRTYFIDVAFPALRVAVEVDGRLHEDDPDVFENDRWRQNALALDGWLVVRFTWAMLQEHPAVVVETIRRALADHGRRFSEVR